MKKILINGLILVILAFFVHIICFMLIIRFYPHTIYIEKNSLSNIYQVVVTILTVLLGLSSIFNFYHSKITAENTMCDIIDQKFVNKTTDIILNNDKVINAFSEAILNLITQQEEDIFGTKRNNENIRAINIQVDDIQEQINNLKTSLDQVIFNQNQNLYNNNSIKDINNDMIELKLKFNQLKDRYEKAY